MTSRHFLTLLDLSTDEIKRIMERASALKSMLARGEPHELMRNRTAVLVFEKSSTRTRVSFETGVAQFGGSSIFLAPGDSQMGRGEPIADTARVLSRMADLIVMRTSAHERVVEMAAYASVPVINGLSDSFHPCQLLADVLTYREHRGDITGAVVAWVGDGNNVCHSWIYAAARLGFQLRIATPESHRPDPGIVSEGGDRVVCTVDPVDAVKHSDLVVTDAWASMGQEEEKDARNEIFAPYQVNKSLMSHAKDSAIFMHCLPAYRGSEVTSEVIDGPQSVVWDQAENRLHAQKALIELLLNESTS